MAIKLNRVTASNQLLKLVSVTDEGIDWDKSFPNIAGLEKKKAHYHKTLRAKELVAKDGEEITVFIFKHPKRVDVSKEIRGLYARMQNQVKETDLLTEVWEKAFVGTQEGFSDEAQLTCPPKIDGEITEEYIQALQDAKVFGEIALLFLSAATTDSSGDLDTAKKK